MTQSRGRRLGGTSGSIKGAIGSWPRTRILALTGEVELHRLLRSILEPNCCRVIAGAVPRDDSATNDPFDVVIVDLESLHLDVISRVVRAYRLAAATGDPLYSDAPTTLSEGMGVRIPAAPGGASNDRNPPFASVLPVP